MNCLLLTPVALALALAASAARAQSAALPWPVDESVWPDGEAGKTHVLAAAAIGSCWRHDPNVGGGGACGEVSAGLDWGFSTHWRLGAEAGFGFLGPNTSGDAPVGVSMSSGGPSYWALRAMVGRDFTRLFFMDAGVQARSTWALGTVDPGLHGFLDFGTRLFDHL